MDAEEMSERVRQWMKEKWNSFGLCASATTSKPNEWANCGQTAAVLNGEIAYGQAYKCLITAKKNFTI